MEIINEHQPQTQQKTEQLVQEKLQLQSPIAMNQELLENQQKNIQTDKKQLQNQKQQNFQQNQVYHNLIPAITSSSIVSNSFLRSTNRKIQCLKCKKPISFREIDFHQQLCYETKEKQQILDQKNEQKQQKVIEVKEQQTNIPLKKKEQEKAEKTKVQKQGEVVECIYCQQNVRINKINYHELLCTKKKQLDRQKFEQRIKKMKEQSDERMRKIKQLMKSQRNKQQNGEVQHQGYMPKKKTAHQNQPRNQNHQVQTVNRNRQQQPVIIPEQPKPRKHLTVSKIHRIPLITSEQLQEKDENQPCPICLSKFSQQDQIVKLQCKHFFHLDCLEQWLKQDCRCPLCKVQVKPVK